MSVLGIRLYGDPVLTRRARPVLLAAERARAAELARDLFETMHSLGGVGLAAPQVGIGLRVAVINIPSDSAPGLRAVLVNPVVAAGEGWQTGEEGCLSFPGLKLRIRRFARIKVHTLDQRGLPVEINAEGLFARALQHEIDHLDGKLFIDRLPLLARLRLRPRLTQLKRELHNVGSEI